MSDSKLTKVCGACGVEKSIDDFHMQKKGKHGRRADCKPCRNAVEFARKSRPEVAERGRQWRKENASRISEQMAEYHARPEIKQRITEYRHQRPEIGWENSYKKRAIKFGFPVVIARFTRPELVAMYGDACYWCGDEFQELDHVIAVRDGGPHTIENCRPSCSECNWARGATADADRRARMAQ